MVLYWQKWQWTAKPTKDSTKQSGVESSKTETAGAVVAGTDDTPLVSAHNLYQAGYLQ